jgi:hypothetical protein
MSDFPNKIDNDVTLPPVNNNLTEIGGEAINALRDAVLNIEEEIGIGASGSAGSIAARLGVTLNPDGYIKPSVLTLLGFVTLPIYDGYIADNAQIKEHKLSLDHSTQDLYDYITHLSLGVNKALGWVDSTGVKLNPHLAGTAYRHELSHIDVAFNSNQYLTNKFNPNNPPLPINFGSRFRDNTNAYSLLSDINNDYVSHQKSDGYFGGSVFPVYTLGGDSYPSNFAHTAAGIYLNTSSYNVIPLDANSLQKFADFIDQNSIFLLGSRIQNLFTGGISRASRSSILTVDGYGPPVVPSTAVKAYLSYNNATSVWDNPNTGDDIIRFFPETSANSGFQFDSQFSLVKAGDVLRINYGLIQTEFLVKEKKYVQSADPAIPSVYAVRIDGKNLMSADGYDGYARIDRPLFNTNKYGVLSVSAAQTLNASGVNEIGEIPSLIVSHPRGAITLGNGFDPSLLNSNNYYLYLVLYPTGNPSEKQVKMAPIDVTGNRGATPGAYTLDSVIKSTNDAFRKVGYNYRFVAFSYQGQFGIMLAEPYNNSAFSIIAGELSSDGSKYKDVSLVYPKNIISYNADGLVTSDPLGFGKNKSNVASPEYTGSHPSAQNAYNFPTKIFLPLRRNNYYIDGVGVESDKFAIEPHQVTDKYGDGYWISSITSQQQLPNRIETTYRVNYNLASSGISPGKTLVVQSLQNNNQINFGRFTIKSVVFNICGGPSADQTDITVYDAIQGSIATNGISPPQPIPSDLAVPNDGYHYNLYFNSDSVGFNSVNSFDSAYNFNFKRHFEVYLNKEGRTFALERARMNLTDPVFTVGSNVPLYSNAELSKINIVRVSPKLRGYSYGTVNKITLLIDNFSQHDNTFSGRLLNRDGLPGSDSNLGPLVSGRKGEVTRFYDETGIDYIDFIFDINVNVSDISNKYISIQLFPTIALDDEVLLLASAQLNGATNIVDHILDLRQFGNISEKDLSTSALNYISAPERLIHANGVVRGFDTDVSLSSGSVNFLEGGISLVNGKLVQLNNTSVQVPSVKEIFGANSYNMLWALCANDNYEYQFIALLDGASQSGAPSAARDIKVYDVSVSNGLANSYSVNGVFFKDLINNRKDLTPLYVLEVDGYYNSGINGVTYNSISLSDVRKFINSEPLNNTFTWADTSAENNIVSYFHSFEAVKNWINYYGKISNHVTIKGNINTSGTLDFSQINLPAVFQGEGSEAGFVMGTTPVLQLGSNITFKDLNFKFLENSQILQINNSSCTFENVNFKFDSTDFVSSMILQINSSNYFNNCIFSRINFFYIVDSNNFSKCFFEEIKNPPTTSNNTLIGIQSYNKFIECSFAILEDNSNTLLLGYNNNVLESCVFGSVKSNNGLGFVLQDDNKLINCAFFTDVNCHQTVFTLRNKNIIENTLFGVSSFHAFSPSSAYQNSNQGFEYFIQIGSDNVINKFNINNIICSSPEGSAIRVYGSRNIINDFNVNSIVTNAYGLVLGDDSHDIPGGEIIESYENTITNSKFNSIQSKIGILLNPRGGYKNSQADHIIIDNTFVNYTPPLFAAGYFNKDDKIRFIGGGAIVSNGSINNVKITNCTLAQNSFPQNGQSEYCRDGGNNKNQDYQLPPLVCFTAPSSTNAPNIIDFVVIDKCRFIGGTSPVNTFYAAVAFINYGESDQTKINQFSNIIIKNNVAYNYNGFIMAGTNNKSGFTAENIVVANNNFSYISAYSSPSLDGGNILIEGNTCDAILTLDNYGNSPIGTPSTTGSMIIDNNTAQYIDVYVNDGSAS